MEKKESNPDLIAPQHHAGMFFELLTDRVNIMWREHMEKKDGKGDEKPNPRSDK